ncbi:MAG TPA: glycosyltransferase [Steroidobacteraceae bacterium]|nr:glycosyltransferase [Steroidobacteraceae bacterium]
MRDDRPLDIVIFGLAITSAWGNGHATTYRALIRALAARGHRVRFFERDVAWYAANRDLPDPHYCEVHLYPGIADLEQHFPEDIPADLVILGSFVPQGAALAEWILPRCCGLTAFYDIDTPVTVAKLERGECDYLSPSLVPRFDLYLSFSGGPILKRLQNQFGALRPRAFYCSVEPRDYYPVPQTLKRYDLGYLGTYSADRQPALERLLLEPAREWSKGRFAVAGAQYPDSIQWPANVERTDHLAPDAHRDFYNSQRLTLNITRADMIASGYSPSVRLFEAAACGVPIMTDEWNGLDEFFKPGRDILIARSTRDALSCLRTMDNETLRLIGARARARVLAMHTAAHRALELESHVREAAGTYAPAGLAGTWTDSTTAAVAT